MQSQCIHTQFKLDFGRETKGTDLALTLVELLKSQETPANAVTTKSPVQTVHFFFYLSHRISERLREFTWRFL